MTVMGQQARDIYKNQKALKQQVADAAGEATPLTTEQACTGGTAVRHLFSYLPEGVCPGFFITSSTPVPLAAVGLRWG